MANSNIKTLCLVFMISLLFAVSMAENRLFGRFASGHGKAVPVLPLPSTPVCNSVYGVKDGDTCFAVTQMFKLTTDFFTSINPNLNCAALFVSQWLCVDGTLV
uniref:LysM domain-containing protein n=1 Tax=Cannabis sativa TaxID=3483 RepID=A0A803NLT8_CANSA